eukprot:2807908-Rhodomonas_salina.2
MPTKATLQEAQERAKVLGCSGVHYLPGPGSTFTAAPCKSQSAELSKLQGQRFTNRDDVGTSVKGASTDLDGTEFRNAWNGFDAADAADSSFLSAKKSATHSVTPSWEGADDADDALLQSRTQAVKRHQHPGAQNLKWHSSSAAGGRQRRDGKSVLRGVLETVEARGAWGAGQGTRMGGVSDPARRKGVDQGDRH